MAIVAEEISMSRKSRGLVHSALALALVVTFIPAAGAQPAQPSKRHHHLRARVEEHRRGDIYVNRNTRSYLDPGPTADVGMHDEYFEDTRYPHYLLGPGIFQRFLTTDGEYN